MTSPVGQAESSFTSPFVAHRQADLLRPLLVIDLYCTSRGGFSLWLVRDGIFVLVLNADLSLWSGAAKDFPSRFARKCKALRLLASVGDIVAETVLRGHCVEA
jgi:hypothetical protein